MLPLMEKNKLMSFLSIALHVHYKSGLCEAQAGQELQFGIECGASKMMCHRLLCYNYTAQ